MSMTAYRPLQYRAAAGFPLGPWGRASLQGASLCTCEKLLERSEETPSASRRLLCVSRATALNSQQVEALLGTSHFVLLLLPPSGVTLNATEAAEIREIEKLLLDRHSTAAVAFSRETRDATVLLERLNRDEEYDDAPARTRMLRPYLTTYTTYSQEWQPIKSVKGSTLTSWLHGQPGQDGSLPPTIVFVAHHDAFAAVPHFATGISTGGSGLITLLWLARELKMFYKREPLAYSVAFVLADASAMNYEGVADWIGRTDPRLLNATRYVLCLDNVASTALSLHTPKAYKDPEASRFMQMLESSLLEEGVQMSKRTKKIAIGEKVLPFWPHEHFTRAKLIAATLSAEPELKHLWNRSSLTDDSLNKEALVKTVRGLAEGTARFLANVEKPSTRLTFRGGEEAFDVFVSSWVKFFAYRNVPEYMSSPFANRIFVKSLSEEMENVGLSTELHEFDVDMGEFSFSYEPSVTIEVSETRPTFFDWLLLLGAAAYSFAIYLAIKGAMSTNILEGPSCSPAVSPASERGSPRANDTKTK
ncbi:hypothetical protein, conserved [Eimeria necatrix]|uniref:BOS complex subunit NCLN n=1 Tax=Eimeria necatrix TaxID=51315 RepID=U6MM29_9EIME|nr:hypothetical protein, conserved [Eimeria necatrix]CDJ64118.1 hypothetical protein, conserved [Eimeria necatrix]